MRGKRVSQMRGHSNGGDETAERKFEN